MSQQSLYVTFWADLFHKFSRKTALAISAAPNGESFLRRLNRLFRCLRGPWPSNKFGKIIQDARLHLIDLLERGEGPELIEMYMAGVCRDRGTEDIGAVELLKALREKKGQPFQSKWSVYDLMSLLYMLHCTLISCGLFRELVPAPSARYTTCVLHRAQRREMVLFL